jgi:flavin-dependent dehydrogenase
MEHSSTFDVVIVGAGPSGLAAANAISEKTSNYFIIDAGNHYCERNREFPQDIPSGVGSI